MRCYRQEQTYVTYMCHMSTLLMLCFVVARACYSITLVVFPDIMQGQMLIILAHSNRGKYLFDSHHSVQYTVELKRNNVLNVE
jgi:hypothetical protein